MREIFFFSSESGLNIQPLRLQLHIVKNNGKKNKNIDLYIKYVIGELCESVRAPEFD